MSGARRIGVVGAGITGLAAARRLIELDPTATVTVWEASGRTGGVIDTTYRDGYLIEHGADNFITNVPWGVELMRRLGLEADLLPTNEAERKAMIAWRGRLVAAPDGFSLMSPTQAWPVLTSPLLSPAGKLRLAWEWFIPARRDGADESLASFVRRRLGREAYDRLVQPLVSGIYTADGERLSMAAALPRFVEMERRHGGLIRAALATRSDRSDADAKGARYGLFAAPRHGMRQLLDAMAAALPPGALRLNTPVKAIEPGDMAGTWKVTAGDEPAAEFDAVIVAVPAPRAAELLGAVAPAAAAELGGIEYAGAAIVVAAYEKRQFARAIEGFGFVVPEIERRELLAASYASRKFPGRAPDDQVLIRAFFGGAKRPDQLTWSDARLTETMDRELGELLGLSGQARFVIVQRWPGSMPQYLLGHVERVARIRQGMAGLATLALAGNAYDGVGVPQCIRSGEQAAEAVLGRTPFESCAS